MIEGRISRALAALAILGIVCAFACRRGDDATVEQIPELGRVKELDRPVQEQYRELRGEVDRLLAERAPKRELAEAFGRFGMWHQLYGFPSEAEASYRIASSLDPNDFRWPYYLSHVYRQQVDLDKARTELRRALELRPDDVAATVSLAKVELELGRADEAEALYRRALATRAEMPFALAGLADVALSRRDFATAAELYERALRRQPRANKLHHSLGLAYRGLGDKARAEEHLKQTQEKGRPVTFEDPLMSELQSMQRGAVGHARIARRLWREGRRVKALERYRMAIEADASAIGLRLAYATALMQSGRMDEALTEFREAVRLGPEDAVARLKLAEGLFRAGEFEAAEAEVKRALEIDRDMHDAHELLARVLMQRGDDNGVQEFGHAIRLAPANQTYRVRRAFHLIRLGRRAEARRTLEEDRKIVPRTANLELLLSRLLAASPEAELRDGKRALELALDVDRSTARTGDELRSRFVAETLAMAYAETGQFANATAWQRAAVEAASSVPQARAPWTGDRLALYERKRPCREPLAATEGLRSRPLVREPIVAGNGAGHDARRSNR